MPNDVNGISLDYTTESSGVVVEGTTFVSLDAAARISELEKLVRQLVASLHKDIYSEDMYYLFMDRPEVRAIMEGMESG